MVPALKDMQRPDDSATVGKIEAGPPGFEPGSEAPEAPMLSKLYYEPNEL